MMAVIPTGAKRPRHLPSRSTGLPSLVHARSLVALLLGMTIARAANAQTAAIDPGMTQAQVVAKLGPPLSTRTSDGHTYLFYKNGCERTCGMNDLVVLDSGKVVDAVFRSPSRKYTGKSSSPVMISRTDARRGGAPTPKTAPPTKKP